jgi:hypothetical protein
MARSGLEGQVDRYVTIAVTDYQLISHLYESANSLVYRAVQADGQSVILKMLKLEVGSRE